MTLSVMMRAETPIALDLNFSVRPGEMLALVGPSGAGKSTVLRTIAGLWRPQSARVTVADAVWHDTASGTVLPPHLRAVGVVFQSYALFPHLDALGNVMLAMRHRPRAARGAEARRLLALVGLEGFAHRRPADLSGGQQQRVALARALAREPAALLLDEPFSAVDRPMREGLYDALIALRGALSMPVVLVTHDMDEAQRLADRMLVIEQGRAVASGSAAEVLSDAAALRVLGLREAGAMIAGIVEAHEADGLSRLRTAAGPVLVPRVDLPVGARLRLRIPAHEVMIALAPPVDISALNALPVVVTGLVAADGPGLLVQLALGDDVAGDQRLVARVTQRSVLALGLVPGVRCHAVLKSMAVARDQVRRDAPDPPGGEYPPSPLSKPDPAPI